jgi:hypothetical protein
VCVPFLRLELYSNVDDRGVTGGVCRGGYIDYTAVQLYICTSVHLYSCTSERTSLSSSPPPPFLPPPLPHPYAPIHPSLSTPLSPSLTHTPTCTVSLCASSFINNSNSFDGNIAHAQIVLSSVPDENNTLSFEAHASTRWASNNRLWNAYLEMAVTGTRVLLKYIMWDHT